MRTGRKTSRRSFTVEVKSSGDRGGSTVIPSRITPAALASPRPPAWPEPAAPAAQMRRILPNLIVPDPTPASTLAAEEAPRRRGRPRKAPAEPTEPTAVEEPAAVIPSQAEVQRAHAPRKPVARPADALAPGERWKRRLGRWAR